MKHINRNASAASFTKGRLMPRSVVFSIQWTNIRSSLHGPQSVWELEMVAFQFSRNFALGQNLCRRTSALWFPPRSIR